MEVDLTFYLTFPSPCGVKNLKPMRLWCGEVITVSVPLRGKKFETYSSRPIKPEHYLEVSVPLRGKKFETFA